MKIKFLTKAECLKELQRVDAFLLCINEYTLKNLLKKSSVNEYIKSLSEAPLDVPYFQKEGIERAVNKISTIWDEMGLPDILVNFAVTNGKDMGMSGLPYTRHDTVFFPTQLLSREYMATDDFVQLVAHEMFHVMSRSRPKLRNEMYKFFGFKLNEDVDIGIVNPDCPVNNYSIEIDAKHYVPYLEMPTSNKLSEHAMMYDLLEKSSIKAKNTKIFDMIGKTTRYVTHPEEICADFFMNLFVENDDIEKNKVLLFKEELLKSI
jgi:hypothetical protein